MKFYTNSITKDELSALPIEKFPGKIVLVEQASDMDKAVAFLSKEACVGFDTETRPSFYKGQDFKISLMQVATLKECFLFRLNKTGMTKALEGFLSNSGILKVGLSLRDDFHAIRKRTRVELARFLDLQDYVGQFGINDASLQKIYGILFQKKISKGQRLTNWDADQLTFLQMKYAALDAWACLVIYNYLNGKNE